MNSLKVILFSALLLLALVACDDGSATVETSEPHALTVAGAPTTVALWPTPSGGPPAAETGNDARLVVDIDAVAATTSPVEAEAAGSDSAELEYFTGNIPPCTPIEGYAGNPCDGVAEEALVGPSMGSSAFLGDAPLPIRSHLDRYLEKEAHFVVRGTFKPNTARCTDGNPDRVPAYIEVRSGLFSNTDMLACFMDVRVNSYILGSGPSELTVMVWYLHYYPGELVYYEEEKTFEKMKENALKLRYNHEAWLEDGIDGQGQTAGKEAILFVGASHNHSLEAWTQVGLWDIETRDDGTVIAVNPVRDTWQLARPEEFATHQDSLEMTIPAFTAAVTTAHQARVAEYGGRIQPADAKDKKPGATLPMLETDANRLTQFYTAAEAYAHEDGPPEPAPPAGCGAMSALSGRDNAGLRGDCTTLLTIEDALRGTSTLNWDTGTSITSWDGITTGGSPNRVTKLELPNKNLTGSVPYRIGDVTGLTHLDLSDNSLTGEIPFELIYLADLSVLKLTGNNFTGCIPLVLEDNIPTNNDLGSLNLLYCQPPAPEGLAAGGVGEASVPLTWTAVSNTSWYRVEYRLRYTSEWTLDDDALTSTSQTVDGLLCATEYQFRVSAYGSGIVYAAVWSDPSIIVGITTGPCMPPVFDATSYSSSAVVDAALDTVVGTVSAAGSLGADDVVTYDITDGNGDGYFAIADETGEITVAGDLSGESGSSFTLTVEATDESGGSATVDVTISVVRSCSSGTAVSNPSRNPGLVMDCNTLLGLENALAGTATLNWDVDTPMRSWDGVSLGGSPQRVTRQGSIGRD